MKMFQYNIKILVDTPFDKKYSILSIEEFRKNETRDTPTNVPSPFTDEKTESVEFVKRITQTRISDTKMQEISSSSGSNETLRLKRTKPLKRDENNLEKTLGITRKKT